jgi:kynurenine formamidase
VGTLHDLSHKLSPSLPTTPGMPAARFDEVWRVPERMANVTLYSFSSHFGTHMDAPRHYYNEGASLDEYDVSRFRGPGFVVPVAGARETEITPAEIAPYRDEIAEAPFVLLSTGWAHHFGTEEYRRHPYLAVETAEELLALGVRCVILDVMTPDKPLSVDPTRSDGPVHRVLLGNDVLIVENAAPMAAVEGKRVEVMVFPIAIEDSNGAPVRLVVET